MNASLPIRLALPACFLTGALILFQESISGTEVVEVSHAKSAAPFGGSSNATAEKVVSAGSTPDSVPVRAVSRMSSLGDGVPTFKQLANAADAGDVRAACMLSTLMAMCAYQDQGDVFKEALLEGAAVSEPGDTTERMSTDRIARIESARQKYEPFCASLTRPQRSQSFDRMLQASRLGSARAALRFFLQPPLRSDAGGIALDRVEQYRDHAIDGLEKAALKGNGLAMVTLFDLLATGRFESNEVAFDSKVDRAKAIALGRAILPILDPITLDRVNKSLSDIEAQASPRELEEARLWSSRFRVDPDQASLDGLPNPAEDVEYCSSG